MFYTIYKITNKINGKIYIGKHQTKDLDDSYMGSGKRLWNSINKHGLENFEKEILFVFETEEEMNAKEAELVTEEFVKEDTNYNLCPGGKGGWGYINSNNLTGLTPEIKRSGGKKGADLLHKKMKEDKNFEVGMRSKWSEAMKKRHAETVMFYASFEGKTHTEETKKLMSSLASGINNSQYGKIWIYSLKEKRSIKIDNDQIIPEGWHRGRKIKFE